MWNQQNGLPVSFQAIDQQFWISAGLPYQVPQQVIPNIPVRPNMQQVAHLAAGFLIGELQNSAQKNPLRIFLYNLASQNGYQNPKFQQMYMGVIEYAEYMVVAQNGRMAIEQALQTASVEICAIMTAVATQDYPQLIQMTGMDQNNLNEIQRLLQRAGQIAAELDRFFGQGMQQQNNTYQHNPRQQQGYGTMAQPQQQYRGAPQAQMPQMGGTMWGDQHNQQQRRWDDQRQTSKDTGSLKPRQPRKNVQEEFTSGTEYRSEQPQSASQPAINSFPDPFANIQGQETTPTPAPVSTPTPSNTPVPAKSSGLQPTWKAGQINLLFNPKTHVIMHKVQDNGEVVELIARKQDDMDYASHELDPKFKPQREHDEATEGKIVPNWDMVSSMAEPLPAEVENGQADPELEGLEVPTPKVVNKVLVVHSAAEAKVLAQLDLLSRDVSLADQDVYEYTYNQVVPFLLEDNFINTFKSMETASSLTVLAQHVRQLRDRVPADLYGLINDRLTQAVNEAIACNLQIGDLNIDSFADDAEELIEAITEEPSYGPDIAAALQSRGGQLFRQNCQVLSGEALGDYIKQAITAATGDDVELAKKIFQDDAKPNFLVVSEVASVTHLPWNAADMDLNYTGAAGAVLASRFPELHAAIAAVFERNRKLCKQQARFLKLVTRDGVTIRLHEGWLGKDFYLISVQ